MLEKSFRVSHHQSPRFAIGDVVNFGTVDNEKFGRVANSLLYMMYIPLSIGIGLYFLYQLLGLAFLPAIAAMLVLMLLNFQVAKKGRDFFKNSLQAKGQRITQTTEMLANIRFIKAHCLEVFFGRKIEELRREEMGWVRKMSYRSLYTVFNIFFTPSCMNSLCFLTCLLSGRQLTVAVIFTTQPRLENAQLRQVGLIIATITLFFVGLFILALTIGRVFKLGYPDTTTMVFEVTARNSESVIGIAAVVFAARPLVTLAILIGPVIELPALLVLTKIMLQLRTRWAWPSPAQ